LAQAAAVTRCDASPRVPLRMSSAGSLCRSSSEGAFFAQRGSPHAELFRGHDYGCETPRSCSRASSYDDGRATPGRGGFARTPSECGGSPSPRGMQGCRAVLCSAGPQQPRRRAAGPAGAPAHASPGGAASSGRGSPPRLEADLQRAEAEVARLRGAEAELARLRRELKEQQQLPGTPGTPQGGGTGTPLSARGFGTPSSSSVQPCGNLQRDPPEPSKAGLDTHKPHGKRGGYEQRFASAGDIIRMAPPDRLSQLRRSDPSTCKEAGKTSLESALHDLSAYFVDQGGVRHALLRPVAQTDPVTHVHREGEVLTACRDTTPRGLEDAAGVTSKRLRYLETDIVTQGEFCERPGLTRVGDGASQVLLEIANDVKHGGQTSAVLTRVNRGVRVFKDRHNTMSGVHTTHAPGPQSAGNWRHEVPEEKLNMWHRERGHLMDGDGKWHVNIAGHEDLLPGGTRPHLSCDRPPTFYYTAQNNKRELAHWECVAHAETHKDARLHGGCDHLVSSDEFLSCMRRNEIDERTHPGFSRKVSADSVCFSDYTPSCPSTPGRQQDRFGKERRERPSSGCLTERAPGGRRRTCPGTLSSYHSPAPGWKPFLTFEKRACASTIKPVGWKASPNLAGNSPASLRTPGGSNSSASGPGPRRIAPGGLR